MTQSQLTEKEIEHNEFPQILEITQSHPLPQMESRKTLVLSE